MEKNMDQENIPGLIKVITKVHGKIIKFKVKESIFGTMVDLTRANGKTTKCMDMEFINGKMDENMMEIMFLTKNKGQGNTTGLMESALKVYGSTEKDKV